MPNKANVAFNNSALRTAGKLCFPVVLGVLISLTPGCGGGGGGSVDHPTQTNTDPTPEFAYPTTQLVARVGEAMAPVAPRSAPWQGDLFAVTPALPEGLSLDPATGVLSGTPERASEAAVYTLTAAKGAQTATATLEITVLAANARTLTYPVSTLVAPTGQDLAGLQPLESWTGGTFTVTPDLPHGLTLDPATGALQGRPTAATGAIVYQITITRGLETATAHLEITVTQAAPAPLNYPITSVSCTQGEPLAPLGPEGHAWAGATFTVSPALPAGLSLDPATGALSGTPGEVATRQTYTITATLGHATGTATLTLEVAAPGQAVLSYIRSTLTLPQNVPMIPLEPTQDWAGGVFTVAPALPSGLSLDAATGVISGLPTQWGAPATHTITVTRGAQTATTTLVIRVKAQARVLAYPTASLVLTRGGDRVSLLPTGAPWLNTWFTVAPALPAGLDFNNTTGEISGSATEVLAATSYTVTATHAGDKSTATVILQVDRKPVRPLTYPAPALVIARNGGRTEFRPSGPAWTGAKFTIAPALPSGLDMDPDTGAITGRPLEASTTRTYTITARHGGEVSRTTVTITVEKGAGRTLAYPAATLDLVKGVAMAPFRPTGGAWTGSAFTVTPALPAGLTLNPDNGTLSGTPTEALATRSFTVTATEFAETSSTVLTLTVREAAPANLRYLQATARYPVGVPIPANTPSHDGGAVTAYGVEPALPAGLTLDGTTGVLSGTPTAATAAAVYRVTATNSAGSATAELNLEVIAASAVTVTLNPYLTAAKPGGTASIPDQGPGATYAWTVTGAAITAGAGTPAVTFTPGAPGPLQATVKVTRPGDLDVLGYALATVVPAPSAAMVVPALAHPGDEHLKASVPEHSGLTYHWTLTAGTTKAALDSDPAKAAVTLKTGDTVGRFDLKVTVQNQAGDHDDSTTTVEVKRGVWITKDVKGPADTTSAWISGTLLADGRVLMVGGRFQLPHAADGTQVAAAIHDPKANLWTSTSLPLTEAFMDHSATLLGNGKVLVIGQAPAAGSVVKCYDPATNTWEAKASMATARVGHTATDLGGGSRILVAGGNDAPGAGLTDASIYDAATDAWTPVSPMANGRFRHTATRLEDGTILVVGGLPGAADAEIYFPDEDIWRTTTGAMAAPDRRGHTACRLENGRVLVVGGAGPGTQAEIYDPEAETWTVTGSLATGRAWHTATALGNAKVLVAGGLDLGNGATPALASSELFDPATGTWAPAGAMQSKRAMHVAVLLGYDKVLTLRGEQSELPAEQYMAPAHGDAAPAGGGDADPGGGGGAAPGGAPGGGAGTGAPLAAEHWNMADFITMQMDTTRTYTKEELSKAYRKLMMRFHPDRNPGDEENAMKRSQDISNAYNRLNRWFD